MDAIFEMDGVGNDTLRVIQECYRTVESKAHDQYQAVPKSRDKLTIQNPDIQYFQKIKHKNHYNYHKSNMCSRSGMLDKIQAKLVHFDPFNREELLKRLTTFTALNWNLPPQICSDLNELKCARNGWKCISFSMNNNTKNHLLCTSCNQQLILKFESSGALHSNGFEAYQEYCGFLDAEHDSDDELNRNLAKLYLQQVVTDGHAVDCCWRQLETTLETIYYPRPYVQNSDESLILNYIHNLKNLLDNNIILSDYSHCFTNAFTSEFPEEKFITNSNTWLLSKYFDNKENYPVILEHIPRWFYRLAELGWTLNIQTFDKQLVLLLICCNCNQRVFLNSTTSNIGNIGINLSSSKILTPCMNRITLDTVEEECAEKINPYTEHKPWCCSINNMSSASENIIFYDYFESMVAHSTRSLQADGEFAPEDMIIDVNSSLKRKMNFDIEDGMERLHKLRKFYLIDE